MKQPYSGLALVCALATLVVAVVAVPARAQSVQSVQIGYIDGRRLETDTRRAYEISEMLRKEFGAREADLRGLEAKVKGLQAQLSAAPAGREREAKEREFQAQAQRLEQVGRALVDDVERRKAEERRKYFVDVTAIVHKMAESQKLDLVVQEAVFAGKAVDMTEQVIKALGGPAPKPAGK